MATKRRRGRSWHYTVKRSALLPRPVYLSFMDEAEGDEYVARLEALLDRGVVPETFAKPQTGGNPLRLAVHEYLDTQHVSAEDPGLLSLALHGLPVDLDICDISHAWADRWVTNLKRDRNLSPSTIRKRVGAMARCLDWLSRSGRLPFNPLRSLPRGYARYTLQDARAAEARAGGIKVDRKRERRLEPGEEEAIRAIILGACPRGRQRPLELRHGSELMLLLDMALESAMRLREMYTLQCDQIDLARRTIFLERTKNGSKRQVPITTVLHALLSRHLGEVQEGRVFPWWNGDMSRLSLQRTTSRLSRQFSRIFASAGCDDLRFHDLRHEATSRIFERTNLNEVQIARITGHEDLRMLKRYANLRGSDLADLLW